MSERTENLAWSLHQIDCDLMEAIDYAQGLNGAAWLLACFLVKTDQEELAIYGAVNGLYQMANTQLEQLRAIEKRLHGKVDVLLKQADAEEQPAA